MKLSNFLLVTTSFNPANAIYQRRSSDSGLDGIYADALPRFGRDLTGWNRGINGAVNVNRAFDDRESRAVTAQNYLEFMIASGKYGTGEEIIAAVEAVQRRAGKQRRRQLFEKSF